MTGPDIRLAASEYASFGGNAFRHAALGEFRHDDGIVDQHADGKDERKTGTTMFTVRPGEVCRPEQRRREKRGLGIAIPNEQRRAEKPRARTG